MKRLLVYLFLIIGLGLVNYVNAETKDPLKKIFGKIKAKIKLKDTKTNKDLTNFILSNKLTLEMDGVKPTYVFNEDKTYNIRLWKFYGYT